MKRAGVWWLAYACRCWSGRCCLGTERRVEDESKVCLTVCATKGSPMLYSICTGKGERRGCGGGGQWFPCGERPRQAPRCASQRSASLALLCSAMVSAHCDALPAWSLSEEAIFLYQARLRCRRVTSFIMCRGSEAVCCFSAKRSDRLEYPVVFYHGWRCPRVSSRQRVTAKAAAGLSCIT